MATVHPSNEISKLLPGFIVCKQIGDDAEDPCLLLDRRTSFNDVLDQIHQYWRLDTPYHSCGRKPDGSPRQYTNMWSQSTRCYSDLQYTYCSIELLVVENGITAGLISPTWNSLASRSSFNVVYWRHRPPRAIKAATPTSMITATVAEVKDGTD
ncbi:hypothetical protein FRB91_000236 [Serendipita sp. 411]|nr:hypothetical protein FRB91_000236 [Serendipita sp. 411]